MAVRFIDGMAHYASADIPLKYHAHNGTIRSSIQPTDGPGGRPCMRHSANSGQGFCERWFTSALGAEVIAGMRVMWSANPSANTATDGYIEFYEGATRHVGLTHDSSFRLRVTRNGTLLATGTTVMASNRWYFIEMRVVIHDTAGEVQVWLNGVPEINVTGVDTKNGASGSLDRVRHGLAFADGSYNVRVVDFYVADPSDSYAMLPLADARVETRQPSGAGAHTDFDNVGGGTTFGTNRVATPTSGTTNTTGSVGATNPNNVLDDSLSTLAGITRLIGNKIRVAWTVTETLNMVEVITHSFGAFKITFSSGHETVVVTPVGIPQTTRLFFPEAGIDWFDVECMANDGAVHANGIYDIRAYRVTDNANWKAVDEPFVTQIVNPYLFPDTDYNSSGTAGDKDTFALPILTSGVGSVLAMQVGILNRKDDAGARTIRRIVRVDGTDYEGSDVSVSDSWAYASDVLTVNPDTGLPWTIAEVNAAEVGVKVEA